MSASEPPEPEDDLPSARPGAGDPTDLDDPGLTTSEIREIAAEVSALGVAGSDPTKLVRIIAQRIVRHHRGPLPDAETFAGYERTLPGAAHRILGMAERTAEHFQEMDKGWLNGSLDLARRGQTFAFIFAVLCVAIGGVLIFENKSNVGALAVLVTAVLAGVGAFIANGRGKN